MSNPVTSICPNSKRATLLSAERIQSQFKNENAMSGDYLIVSAGGVGAIGT